MDSPIFKIKNNKKVEISQSEKINENLPIKLLVFSSLTNNSNLGTNFKLKELKVLKFLLTEAKISEIQ